MLASIVEFSTKNRFLVVFLVLLVGAVGVRAAQRLPIDAVPDVTNVQVQILTTAPALGPLEVEQFITSPIENVMGGLPLLEEVRSVSKFGLSAITVVFEEGTDIFFARQMVAERLADAREAIPAGYGLPEMGPISSGLGEIYQFEVKGDPMCAPDGPDTDACWTSMELRTVLDWYVAYQLRSVRGVVEVNSFGGELKTYEVQIDPRRLVSRQVSLSQVFEALEKNNGNAGGAYIESAGEQLLIRGEGLVANTRDIERIVVTTDDDSTPVYVGDLATVATAPMVRQGAVTRDGKGEAVIGIAMMLLGENSRTVAEAVQKRIVEIQPTLPKGVTIDTFYDRTALVKRTIKTVATNLFEGGILVIAVLLLLLGNIRAGLLVAVAIPLSMLTAFIGMNAMGLSGNLMSLGAIDFGLIVDGSVVIVENIVRRLAHNRTQPGEVEREVTLAAKEVARPVAFAVAIIMIVYLPILTLQGIEGKMFRPMAFTVVFALAASLVFALTLMPAMAAWVFSKGVAEEETWLVRRARRIYEPLLDKAMHWPKRTFGAAVVAFVLSLAVVPFLGAEFVPTLDEGALAIQAVRMPSTSLEESVRSTTQLERVLLEQFPDEVKTVVSKTGRPEIATDPMGVDISDIFIITKPPDEWKRAENKDELVEEMEDALSTALPGQNFSFSQPIELRTNELISGVRSDVAVAIYGDDLDQLKRTGDLVVRILSTIDGAADVKAEQVAGLPVLRIRVDRDRIARYGINASDVLDAVSAMGGHQVGEVFEGQRRFALQVRFAKSARTDVDAIRSIPIAAPDGTLVPLGQLADLDIEEGPAQVSRERAQRRITVEANVRGRDLAGFVGEAQTALLESSAIPKGYFVEWGGQFENLQAASGRLALAVPLALLLIFVLLYMTYGSSAAGGHGAVPAFVIYLNIPFAATGGIVALALRGMPFSISAGIGFIALFGVAVLNGVVLMSQIRQLEAEGQTPWDASNAAARSRLRPVLMTALVASLGFVPMAIATSAGAEVQRPLATVVIGGLITSTLLTLIVLPTIYARIRGGEPPEPTPPPPTTIAPGPGGGVAAVPADTTNEGAST
ncbi:MAG: efflux RND transporter permease subunit [Deltaproteobacteria bacterium]|nr:efflux RND transporter permease subunit [Deltaproteobacteria bacterium]